MTEDVQYSIGGRSTYNEFFVTCSLSVVKSLGGKETHMLQLKPALRGLEKVTYFRTLVHETPKRHILAERSKWLQTAVGSAYSPIIPSAARPPHSYRHDSMNNVDVFTEGQR